MRKTKAKKCFEQKDIELLDNLIDHFDQLLLWEMGYGVLGTINERRAKELQSRFRKLREKEGKGFSTTTLNEEGYKLGKSFFCALNALLIRFVACEGLGTEYDKRRAQRFSEIALVFNKIAND